MSDTSSDPSIADVVTTPGVLPSELAKTKLSRDMRIKVTRMFFEKLGFTVERVLKRADGSIEFTVR